MALTNCPECDNQVSNRATECPRCGFPLMRNSPQQRTDYSKSHIQTIQLTRKRYKAMQLVGGVMLFIGLVNAMSGGPGAWMLPVGLLLTVTAKFLIWWHHR